MFFINFGRICLRLLGLMVRQLRVGYHTGYERKCINALPLNIVAILQGKFLPKGWAGVATYFCSYEIKLTVRFSSIGPLLSLIIMFDIKIK